MLVDADASRELVPPERAEDDARAAGGVAERLEVRAGAVGASGRRRADELAPELVLPGFELPHAELARLSHLDSPGHGFA